MMRGSIAMLASRDSSFFRMPLLAQFGVLQGLLRPYLVLQNANFIGGNDVIRTAAEAEGVLYGGHPEIDAVAAADIGDAIPATALQIDALPEPFPRSRTGAGMRRRPPVSTGIDMVGCYQHPPGIHRQQRCEAKKQE